MFFIAKFTFPGWAAFFSKIISGVFLKLAKLMTGLMISMLSIFRLYFSNKLFKISFLIIT